MFTPDERTATRDDVLAHARADPDVIGAALVGSAAGGREDQWSDIDVVLQLRTGVREPETVERWTRWLRERHGVADTVDVFAQGVRYRVFLLTSSLQIDLSFWPEQEFRATEAGFQLVFGEANEPSSAPDPDVDTLIGMGWLYALHARSALARGKLWQAQLMLDHLREQAMTLACVRHGLSPWHGREVDDLPAGELAAWAKGRPRETSATELARATRSLITCFMVEIEHLEPSRARALRTPLALLAEEKLR